MTTCSAWRNVGVVFMMYAAMTPVHAQSLRSLLSFNGNNGADPNSSLIQGPDGGLYGTTAQGGNGYGIVFKLTPSGKLTTVYSFCSLTNCADGSSPAAGLVLSSDGSFYGTTAWGGSSGAGTVFKLTISGSLSTLHDFSWSDGAAPQNALVQAADGNFYGTTLYGGSGQCQDPFGFGCGTVFKLTPRGILTTLHNFDKTDGAFPYAALLQASDGALYGTTQQGGPVGGGTVFRVTLAGVWQTIYDFCTLPDCADGSFPVAPLVQGIDGDLYGVTATGGASDTYGTLFKITGSGKLITLHNFDGTDGWGPDALVQATDGNFYGTAGSGGDLKCDGGVFGCGTLFKVTPGGALTKLHNFELSDGLDPYDGLLQATDGNFYGLTTGGGSSEACFNGCGTMFSFDAGLGRFVSFVRNPAKVGQVFGVLGQGLTGTTGVQLNGTPAGFTVKSNTLLEATVPAGATTGFVTVTTPSGTLTSNVPFRVLK